MTEQDVRKLIEIGEGINNFKIIIPLVPDEERQPEKTTQEILEFIKAILMSREKACRVK